MKNLIDFYDDTATMWADTWYNNDKLLPYLKIFLKHINKPNPRILDLCCGAGYESMRLKNLGAEVVGIDISEKSLDIAREKNPTIPFYNKNMLNSYAELGHFDGIACIAGLIHLQGEELNLAFRNMHEVLNSGAFVFIVVRCNGIDKKTCTYNGTVYDRNLICHSKEELIERSKGLLEFIDELPEIENWHYFIFKKI